MKTGSARGTMLTSTALILCCASFGAGFLCGDLVSDYRAISGPAEPIVSSVPQAVPTAPVAEADKETQTAEHIRQLRAQAQQNPDDAGLWTHLGNVCYDAGDHDGAIEAYRRSLALVPGNADVMTDMGSMYRMKGQPEQAVRIYEQAIALNPGHSNAVFNKGVTLMLDMEQPEQAVAFWRDCVGKQPSLALNNGVLLREVIHEIAADAAMQLEAHGRNETALRAYAEALKLREDFLPALIHKAWLLEKMQRGHEALPLWRHALTLDPQVTDPSGKPVRDRVR